MKKKMSCLFVGILLATLFTACEKQPVNNTVASCCQKPQTMQPEEAPGHLSDHSVYQLTGEWRNQDNKAMPLRALKGKVQLVAMIFTHCAYACPKMVDNMRSVEASLPQQLKAKTGFTLISFDTERDSVAQLKAFAGQKDLDAAHWTLLSGTEKQVRTISMLLQVQYNKLPSGDFNHSNVLTVLNGSGEIIKQFEGLDINVADVVKIVHDAATH